MKKSIILIIAAFAAFSAQAQTSHTPTMRDAVLKNSDAQQPRLQRVSTKVHYFGTRFYAAAKRRGLAFQRKQNGTSSG